MPLLCPQDLVRILATLLMVGLLSTAYSASAQDEPANSPFEVPNPGTELWRGVRHAVPGQTQVHSIDSGTLISAEGEQWRQFRMEILTPNSAMILAAVIGLFFVYFLIRGRIRIKAGRSGRVIERYSLAKRWIHWFTAVVFLILMITGLILLFGRWALLPWLGAEAFSATARWSTWAHNFTGPVFVLAVILMFFSYLREALIDFKVDTLWLLRAGGYLGGKHPSAGKINAGQKAWYWSVVIGGALMCITGLALDFPNLVQSRDLLRDAYQLHTITGVFLMAFLVVHVYLGSIGTEGALEAMTRGHIDANWAKQHHDLWYEEVKDQAAPAPEPTAAPGAADLSGTRAET